MTGAFEHRVVHVGKAEAEAKRCSVCGSPPDISWIDASLSMTYRVMMPGRLSCPNGPHEMTEDEYRATQDALPIYSKRVAADEPAPRRRWWRR